MPPMPVSPVSNLLELFREYALVIPDYQRGYAWEAGEVTDFLEDLDLLPAGRVHYTGTVILNPVRGRDGELKTVQDAAGVPYQRAEVVDGQQRLTTAIILLSLVARELKTHGETSLADGVHTTFVETPGPNEPLLKLRLNHDPEGFWLRNVLGEKPSADPPTIVSERRLLAARSQMERYLSQHATRQGEGFVHWLKDLRLKIVQHLRITVYEVEDSAEVGVIFETQNDRGKDLTYLEKTKNFLLYLSNHVAVVDPHLDDIVNEVWSKILSTLNQRNLVRGEDENTLLFCHWVIAYDPRPREWKGFDSIKSRFTLRKYQGREEVLAKDLRTYLRGLKDCVEPLCDVYAPTHSLAFAGWRDTPEHQHVVEWSEKLRRLGSLASLVPVLVAARLRDDIGPADYAAVARAGELFSFRSRAARSRSDAGRSSLVFLGSQIFHRRVSASEILETLAQQTRWAGSARMVRFQLDTVADWYNWGLVRYVLYEYELKLAGTKHPPGITWRRVEGRTLTQSVEHILPQEASDPYWQQKLTARERARYTDDLGNLCLTYDNSAYKNKSFPEKKGEPNAERPCYARSPLYQERALCLADDWTAVEIKARRRDLLNFIFSRWEIEEVAPADAATAALISASVAEAEGA